MEVSKSGLLYKDSYRISEWDDIKNCQWRNIYSLLAGRIIENLMTREDIKNVFGIDESNIDADLTFSYHYQFGCEPTDDEAIAFLASKLAANSIKNDLNTVFELTMQETKTCYQYDCILPAFKYLK